MFTRAMAAVVVLGLGLGACGTQTAGNGDDDGVPPRDGGVDALARECTETIGDLARPVEVRPVYVDYRGETQPIADGAVGLIAPIQGGYVLMVGLEARNLRGCTAEITGTLRVPGTGAAIAVETRLTQLLIGADGWGHLAFPPTATTANLTTCPLNDLADDIDGHPYRLELEIVDERGQRASWSGDVVPFCRPNDPDPAACPCQCDADFVFGQPCPVDP